MSLLDKLRRLLTRDRDDDDGRGEGGRDVAQSRLDRVGDLPSGSLPTGDLPKGGYDEGRPPR